MGHDCLTFYSACEGSKFTSAPQVHQSVTDDKKGIDKLLNSSCVAQRS